MYPPLEGDLAVLRDGSVWVVKGCYHPRGYFIGVPRYVEGIGKIKRLSEALVVVRRYYSHYLRFIPEVGVAVPRVPLAHVAKYLSWRSGTVSRKVPSRLRELCGELLRILSDVCGLTCGPAGSLLGGYSTDYSASDIDIVCFDSAKAYECVKELRMRNVLKPLRISDFVPELISVSETIPEYVHLKLVSDKVLQGTYKGVRYTLRLVNCSRHYLVEGPYSYIVRPKELVCTLKTFDYRTPSIISANVIKSPLIESLEGRDVLILTHRIRFAELPKGTLLSLQNPLVMLKQDVAVVNIDYASIVRLRLPT